MFNAYRLYKDPEELILAQSATDADAKKTSRATAQMLEQNPLAWNCKQERGSVTKWWIKGSSEVKHGNMHVRGILSNVTGARASLIVNDDTETPTTTASPELREKLRYRLSEQIHILIPKGQRLFVGTPHAQDSLYANLIEAGANNLVLKMFEKEARFTSNQTEIRTTFKPIYIFSGIGTHAKLLKDFDDYTITKQETDYLIKLKQSYPLIDCYSEALWIDRFTSEVMEQRRKECTTLGEWDSQYLMHNRSINEIRLDPDRLIPYSAEVTFHTANRTTMMMLGDKRIVSATLKVDPSSGKTKSDVSAAALVLQDEQGRLYWHRSIALLGDVAVTDDNGQFTGGQAWQVADLVKEFKLPNLVIETNRHRWLFPFYP
ncbi:phage terminase large subunit [Acinetobacter bereziniae]|uniref:phage terminase large subunit n=1 Tax=Acinetobacter bereziniae TaxID=106648 RepID=UPI002A186DF2|nr:phage terminase large subunit [Acinetobacter bereziniae]